mmetsp:Transcript_5179/g.16549  ORF Transcript_5179/g.16549 Transcript_5179/m.16549 type:complete len:261 (-) Transcript_5179:2548-3330(-)
MHVAELNPRRAILTLVRRRGGGASGARGSGGGVGSRVYAGRAVDDGENRPLGAVDLGLVRHQAAGIADARHGHGKAKETLKKILERHPPLAHKLSTSPEGQRLHREHEQVGDAEPDRAHTRLAQVRGVRPIQGTPKAIKHSFLQVEACDGADVRHGLGGNVTRLREGLERLGRRPLNKFHRDGISNDHNWEASQHHQTQPPRCHKGNDKPCTEAGHGADAGAHGVAHYRLDQGAVGGEARGEPANLPGGQTFRHGEKQLE